MKRFLSFLILGCVIFGLCACKPSKPDNMDEEHYNIGKSALEIADAYLDFKLSKDEAVDRLDSLSRSLERLPEAEDSDPVHFGNALVDLGISSLRYRIASGSDSEVLDRRNTLADTLDMKARK